jgi:hypothetical protein
MRAIVVVLLASLAIDSARGAAAEQDPFVIEDFRDLYIVSYAACLNLLQRLRRADRLDFAPAVRSLYVEEEARLGCPSERVIVENLTRPEIRTDAVADKTPGR